MNKLTSTAEVAKRNLNQETIAVIADKGYESAVDIEKCLMNGIIPDVGFTRDRNYRVFNMDYIPSEITEEVRSSRKAEDIRKCLHAGVLPACYENAKGKAKVYAEVSLMYLSYNIRRALTLAGGTQGVIAFFLSKTEKLSTIYAEL